MEIYHPKDEELLREMKRVRRVLKQRRLFWGLMITLVLMCVFGWFVYHQYCTLAVMKGPAMGETLPDGSLVLVWRNNGGEAFGRGDIVLYETEDGAQIKRILAVENDQVVVGLRTRVNGEYINEPYAIGRNADADISIRRMAIDTGKLFVQGDQRSLSVDSRSRAYDTIEVKDVIGTVRFVLWPYYRFGEVKPDAGEEAVLQVTETPVPEATEEEPPALTEAPVSTTATDPENGNPEEESQGGGT